MIKKANDTIFFLLFSSICISQPDTSKNFSLSGYCELYYSCDFTKLSIHEKPGFLYNYKRNNEVNINLAYGKLVYKSKMARANLAFMIGNYAHYNLASEEEWSRFVYEASIGLKVSKKKNIWLDAGIMPSHIGFESVVGVDCWNLTRSIVAENSPYYEAGIRLGYTTDNDKLFASLLFLNGWQHIRKPDGINKPSAGMQVNYKISHNVTINYSNFTGTDKPDSLRALRTYHNFYFVFDPIKKWGIIAGFDLGTDKKINHSYSSWYSPILIARRKFGNKFLLAGRLEYFSDPDQLIIPTGTAKGFQAWGQSINFDFILLPSVMLRLELRSIHSKNQFLAVNNDPENYSRFVTASFSLKL